MKNFLLIILLCMLAISVKSQDEIENDSIKTIFKKVNFNGGYGAFISRYTEIDHRSTLLVGGKAAWLINKKLGLGISTYGFMNKPIQDSLLNLKCSFKGETIGLLIEPVFGSNNLIHVSLPLVIGGGRIGYQYEGKNNGTQVLEDVSYFAFVEPGAEIELNLFDFFRVGFGAYYRITTHTSLRYRISESSIGSNGLMRGFSYGVTFKFGVF